MRNEMETIAVVLGDMASIKYDILEEVDTLFEIGFDETDIDDIIDELNLQFKKELDSKNVSINNTLEDIAEMYRNI